MRRAEEPAKQRIRRAARRRGGTLALVVLLVLALGDPADALFIETSKLGPTGQFQPNLAVSTQQWLGVRFEVESTTQTDQIGGHFGVGGSLASVFAAIVALDGPSDFPDSFDLSTPDRVAVVLLAPPITPETGDVFSDIDATLEPGWYAMVFGSGAFGSLIGGGAQTSNVETGTPSYIILRNDVPSWGNLENPQNLRFVLTPEPAGAGLAGTALAAVSLLASRRRSQPSKST